MTEVHRIEGTDRLLMQTIQDQAADLEHGWREALTNAIDSPGATRAELEYNADRTVVRDNGDGVDLDTDRGLALLKNLGETSKADDEDAIGTFGVGKGQVVAKGHTAFISGDVALHYDIKEWGLEVKTIPLPDDRAVDGLEVRVSHYEDEVPSSSSYKWDRFESRLSNRYRFLEVAKDVEVFVNGEKVSGQLPSSAVSGNYAVVEEPEIAVDAVVALEPDTEDDIEVYSNGVYVKDIDGHGVSGVVVTRQNLDLNFARNEIKSGCPAWTALSAWVEDRTEELLRELPDSRLTNSARSFLAERALDMGSDIDPESPVFQTVTGEKVSLNDITSASQFGFASRYEHRAKKLSEGWSMLVLDTEDDATSRLQRKIQDLREKMDIPDEFDVDEKAEQVSLPDDHEVLADEDLNSVQARKLAAARELARRMAVERDIKWGESEVSDAWTDGDSEIVLTDDAADSRNRSSWLPQVFRSLVHQWSHRSDTESGCDDDTISFRRRYTQRMDDNFDVMTDMAEQVDRAGLAESVDPIHRALL